MKKDAKPAAKSGAERLLSSLAEHGIDYFFFNPGTDFAPIIEAFAGNRDSNAMPRPMLMMHENTAVTMAHGVTLATGKPQAVMVHTSVGTGNAVNALINASRDRAPMVLMAGRSPLYEQGPLGARNGGIHWGQEMFDQGGMVREWVKWDYELRGPEQAEAVVARGYEMATTSPQGPVYITLPREPLAERGDAVNAPSHNPRPVADLPGPSPQAVATLADWIAGAKAPLIISSCVGRRPGETEALQAFAERFAIPVVLSNPHYMCIPASSPMHQGFMPGKLLPEADLVIVIESDVPWMPSQIAPDPSARIVQMGEDPIYARYPMRSFPTDLTITAATVPALEELTAALDEKGLAKKKAVAERARKFAKRHDEMGKEARAKAVPYDNGAISPEYLSRCIAEAVGDDAIIVNEYPLRVDHAPREEPGTYFSLGSAGGLGWAVGAALGVKLARPERLVVAVAGDGAYVFANPTACHWAAEVHKLPILTIVFNNALYGAVRGATLSMYAGGNTKDTKGRFLAELPATDYEKLVEANGGYGERVEDPAELPKALKRAIKAVEGGRQALLNVVTPY
ncbi:MAG TPA: thiamine pyrophosphate-requiring protein [Hyphomicrobiales bacterium]|nr:thiamine pyrophosphate-requiring protein [Hyphomicrobiales bacterium]